MARSGDSYSQDPILRYRPPFVQSLPVQILLSGVVLTLSVVLLFHLVFTAQYHWPLARTNYILQTAGVTTLIVSIVATIYVIFSTTLQQSQHWPYMLSYLAVEMPAAKLHGHGHNSTDPIVAYQHTWSPTESATWTVMNATTSVVVQITHIHFLTLLFPSDLEARLIFGLLGPLAVISAVMQLLPLIHGTNIISIAEDTRNVCNAALSLLFTAFLIIWGFFVNRRQAWRTDGGTAAFGAGAIVLAFISTTLNLVYIPQQDQYTWVPKFMWAITLWQSFLGWWWWVGAGMGVREVEDLLSRENKRHEKRLLRAQRRKEHREKARSVWKGVTGALFNPGSPRAAEADMATAHNTTPERSSLSPSCDMPANAGGMLAWTQPFQQLVQRWYARLRHAHLTAAHMQATERAERLHQVYRREEERYADREYRNNHHNGIAIIWGPRSYGLHGEEIEMEERIPQESDEDEDDENWKDVPMDQDAIPDVDTELRYRGTVVDPARTSQTDSSGSSVWWWGPLRRWRLKDSTTYR